MEQDQASEYTTDRQLSLDDIPSQQEEDRVAGPAIGVVMRKFHEAENARRIDEERWLRAYRNYRGIYGPDVQFTETEKSRVFIKVTKTKVLAAYGQIIEVLFSNNTFPLSVEPTILPEGVVGDVHFDPKDTKQKPLPEPSTSLFGYAGDGSPLPPGSTINTLMNKLGSLKSKLQGVTGLKEGVGQTPTSITFSPAMVAAKKMEKKIKDQLDESKATKQLRHAAFEMSLFGTGIMKGPFAFDKEYANWKDDGTYSPVIKTRPDTSHVSVWNFYPDPDANSMEETAYCIERHKLSRSQLRELKKRPFFRKQVIDDVITRGETYVKKYWEDDLRDYRTDTGIDRFEVLEFWGSIESKLLVDNGVKIPSEFAGVEELQANIWICNGRIIRMVLNPFKPAKIPYHVVPYELNPYSMFGIGVAENMEDSQILMNGFMRMAVDNGVLSGNLVFEVDETNLVPGQDLKIYPGKVFRRQGGAPGQAIFGTKFPNVSNENMQMFDKARVLADEATGIPSFSHGQTGVAGVGRTASGISMLMNAASGTIKTVIKNVDDYLLRPLGEAFFNFNMQFDFDPEIRGDLEVKARGTESLMANEVRSQRLMQFLQIGSSPALMPFTKFQYIIREIAKSMDLDPDKVTNNMEEAALQAALMAAQQPQQAAAVPPMGVPGVADTAGTGGGNIGVGQVPVPGEQGFTGNVQPIRPTAAPQ
jgi:hypothetical protein